MRFANPSSPDAPPPDDVCVSGVHGGAGTTTVARLLNAIDLDRDWPGPRDPRYLFLIARTDARGLTAASQALAGYRTTQHPEGPYLAGFILVADAPGRLPKPLKRRIHILASAASVYRLVWIPEWRLSEIPHNEAISIRLRQFATRAIEADSTREDPSCIAA